jgi:hypothetical protein
MRGWSIATLTGVLLAAACASSSSEDFEPSGATNAAEPGNGSGTGAFGDGGSAPSCTDGVKNGSESDVDCGGSECKPCIDGRACFVATDCETKQCSGGICCVTKEYTKDSGPKQGQSQICCEKGDDLVTYSDCGTGADHVVMPAGNCAFLVADDGVACAKITCRSSTCAKSCQGLGYQKSTGPAGGQVCCEKGDKLVKVIDCGNGKNHSVTTSNECGIAVEGSGNYGSACAQILCSTKPCPNNPDAGTIPMPK